MENDTSWGAARERRLDFIPLFAVSSGLYESSGSGHRAGRGAGRGNIPAGERLAKTENPPDGTVVLALLHGEEVTIKRLYRDGENVRLRYQNGKPREIVLPAEDVQVQGEIIRVIHAPVR